MNVKVSVKQEDVDIFYFIANAIYVALHMSLAGIKKELISVHVWHKRAA